MHMSRYLTTQNFYMINYQNMIVLVSVKILYSLYNPEKTITKFYMKMHFSKIIAVIYTKMEWILGIDFSTFPRGCDV